MEMPMHGLIDTKNYDILIQAVQDYADAIHAEGIMLTKASECCKGEMDNDDLSLRYTKELDSLLNEKLKPVFKELANLKDELVTERQRLWDLLNN